MKENSTDIFINKNIWKEFSEEQMENYVNEVFIYYRERGFPFFSTDEEYRGSEYFKTSHYCLNNDVYDEETKSFKQTMHGLGLCWSYFPHSFAVKCNNKLSPIEAFNNDEVFLKVIKRRIKMGDNISDNGIRKMIKIFTNVQGVSNFRPTAAASIYKYAAKLLEKETIDVWDMSGGYGGRLLGAKCSNVVNTYICTDPCKDTFNSLKRFSDDLGGKWSKNIHMCGSEDFITENKVDLCFTSPPYFDTEKYSDEDTQSYKKFDSKDKWLKGFLEKTIDNCFQSLKDDGLLMLNIANIPNYKTLEEDFLAIMNDKKEWEILTTQYLALSSLNKENKYKYEPIYVFKKKTIL